VSATKQKSLRDRIETIVTLVILLAGVAWVALGRLRAPAAEPVSPALTRSAARDLASATRIHGVPCAPGKILWFPAANRVEQCTLSEQAIVGNEGLPPGSMVALNVDGTLRYVQLPDVGAVLQGHSCRGSKARGWMTTFRADGSLEQCWLGKDEVVRGVPCAAVSEGTDAATAVSTRFHANGAVASCRLSKELSVAGMTIAQGTRVQMDSAGVLATATRR
jgi:hypothetical protein